MFCRHLLIFDTIEDSYCCSGFSTFIVVSIHLVIYFPGSLSRLQRFGHWQPRQPPCPVTCSAGPGEMQLFFKSSPNGFHKVPMKKANWTDYQYLYNQLSFDWRAFRLYKFSFHPSLVLVVYSRSNASTLNWYDHRTYRYYIFIYLIYIIYFILKYYYIFLAL